MKIIKDIVRGERDPLKLAKHRHENCKATEAEIAAALHGNWRAEHLFALKQALKLYEFYQQQLRECEAQIEACLRSMADKSEGAPLPASARKRRRKPEKNEVRFGARALLFRMAGVDLTVIEGISETTALVILSEIGTDLSDFPHEKNFVSWLGLCPQHRGSAGKIFKRRTRRGANRAARALRMAAQGCHHAKNALGAFYRRIQARAGGAESGGGDGAEDRRAGVSAAEVRPGVRASKRGSLRGGVSAAAGEGVGEEGGEPGLQAGAGNDVGVKVGSARRPPAAKRPDQQSPQKRRPVRGEGEVVDGPAEFPYKTAKDTALTKDLFLGSWGRSGATRGCRVEL